MGNNPTALQVPDRLQPRTYHIKRPRTPGDAISSVLADGSRAGPLMRSDARSSTPCSGATPQSTVL